MACRDEAGLGSEIPGQPTGETLTALSTIQAIVRTGLFANYALMSVLCWVFVYFLVPETNGRGLEEIERALLRGGRFKANLDEVSRGAADSGRDAVR